MTDFLTLKNDIKSFKRVRRVLLDLIHNFPSGLEITIQEERLQLLTTRLYLEKTISRLEKLLEKSS